MIPYIGWARPIGLVEQQQQGRGHDRRKLDVGEGKKVNSRMYETASEHGTANIEYNQLLSIFFVGSSLETPQVRKAGG